MAPFVETIDSLLSKRQTYYCRDGYYSYWGGCASAWTVWGRWVLAGIIVVVALLIFFIFACVTARRRRSRGAAPMYGTGWMAPGGHYGNNPGAYNAPPPAYGAPQSYPMQNQYTGTTFNPNDGYYGQQQGVQPPKNVYDNAGRNDYAPPTGPPPSHIR